ncbi:dihydrofolate synthase / folylpolyglutamate synthase [Salinimicrobium catena]|uniref:Dihydrofolate synthase/folylpolyglutamate synthase n=1 Tax=Salinimicrobium catena TaxID=390640 RepID=A0A1H5NQA6_9FLAO|nr:folylpolyglutamate synthase/dihydrofolate synthase family protein [Salinimicrobium catena]SDL54605.1 dihydrofolate synthase / folylpolyglutamate synthase [Salinimicrobium catena]SEF03849.1 dihydrofolate synthase / folylpolyglutamate synthase [Salinimicrobium catena]
MTYQETVDWMFQQLPMYQQVGNKAYKVDLSNIKKLAAHLQEPQENFKSIHVAGTNGKGSVSHMLASVLQESGYKVGLYTSPHLKDFRERIKINGKEISQEAVTDFIAANKCFFEREQLSFFEMTVGMAFQYFSQEKVDVAVIEVGLGGRLDSTNIISPEVSVITNIGLDHTSILGNTLELIAAEKGGIIKRNTPVVIGEFQPETFPVFERMAAEVNAPLHSAATFEKPNYGSDLKGAYQEKNIRSVLKTVEVLREKGWKIPEKAVENGLLQVIQNTGLRGRWDVLQENPKVICDTAHNKEGLQYAMKQLQEEDFERLLLVIGMVNDKDLEAVLPLFPKEAEYFFCRPNIPRGLDAEILKQKAAENGLLGEAYNSVSEAYQASLKKASKADVVYVGGSTFTVAEII